MVINGFMDYDDLTIFGPDVQILSCLRSLHQGRGLGDSEVVGHQLYVDLAGVQLPALTILL